MDPNAMDESVDVASTMKGGGGAPALAAPPAAAASGAPAAAAGPKGSRSVKKKTVKATKAAALPKAATQRKKKTAKDEVVFDLADLHAPLPVNLNLYCKSNMTGRYHQAKILDRRIKDDKFKIQSVPWPESKNPPLPLVEGVQPDFAAHTHIYYIHFLEWDRRMDEWVFRDRLCLPSQVLQLQPPSYNIAVEEAAAEATAAREAAAAAGGKEKTKEGEDEEEGDEGDDAAPGAQSKKKGKSSDSKSKQAKDAAPSNEVIPGGDPHGGSLGGHGNFCLAADHQVLTNGGFLGMETVRDVVAHRKSLPGIPSPLLFATMNPETETLEYRPAAAYVSLNVSSAVNFTQKYEARRWTHESDKYGRTEKQQQDAEANSAWRASQTTMSSAEVEAAHESMESRSNAVSLLVSGNHKMWVETGTHGASGKIHWSGTWDYTVTPKRRVPDGWKLVRADEIARSSTFNVVKVSGLIKHGLVADMAPDVVRQLALNTPEKLTAFLELYGYWLGDGSLMYGNNKCITYSPRKKADRAWLEARFPVVFASTEYSHCDKAIDVRCYTIYNKLWVRFLWEEYRGHYSSSGHGLDEEAVSDASDEAKQATDAMEDVPAVAPALGGGRVCQQFLAVLARVHAEVAKIPIAQLVAARSEDAPPYAGPMPSFAHIIERDAGGKLAYIPVAERVGQAVSVVLNLKDPLSRVIGTKADGITKAATFRNLEESVEVAGVPLDIGWMQTESNPVPWASGSCPLFAEVRTASMAASLASGAAVIVAFGGHVQADWRTLEGNPARLVTIEGGSLVQVTESLAFYELTATDGGRAVFVVKAPHPMDGLVAGALRLAWMLATSGPPNELELRGLIAWEADLLMRREASRAAALMKIKSAKWFMPWVFQIGAVFLRHILTGLRMADGAEAMGENKIFTSSTRFRDEIVRVALHAGFSPTFGIVCTRGDIRGLGVEAMSDAWYVSYRNRLQAAQPTVEVSDVKEKKYRGVTWCVNVPPFNLIVARRAHVEDGVVTKASMPLVVGNSDEDIKAHEEATKVKNIESIVMGKFHMSTWYYSPFPPEYNQYNVLHFCEFCLNFYGYEEELKRHSRKCQLRHPPGNEIYRSQEKNVNVSVWEVDGAREKVYCQNLCWIAKLFLDHKTLEFDSTPFLFYVFCESDEVGYHIVGYFSKEKISVSKFNLACILTLPCHQRKGYGKLIISLSYELSKIEEKVGSPEKPISDLGKVSYMSYWSSTLLKLLSQRPWASDAISIEDLSRLTCITTDDIIECLKGLHILIWYKGKWVFSDTALQQCLRDREEKRLELAKKVEDPNAIFVSQCRPALLHWTPFFVKDSIKALVKRHGQRGE